MSNYTTFFPSATGGGSTEITDPDKINKITLAANNTSFIEEMFYTSTYTSTTSNLSNSANCPYLGTGNYYGLYGSGAVSQTTDNTEITLANVTNGSGYLCCIITPVGGLEATQEIKITVDGGTEKVYSFDYSSDPDWNDIYTRLLWGFAAWGSDSSSNLSANPDGNGILGLGGATRSTGSTSLPPQVRGTTGKAYLRLYSASEFKNYNLPKLRFESSILVKCKTNGIYSTSGYASSGSAKYYLDSQL
jgi:hypothetical protein